MATLLMVAIFFIRSIFYRLFVPILIICSIGIDQIHKMFKALVYREGFRSIVVCGSTKMNGKRIVAIGYIIACSYRGQILFGMD